MLLLPRMTGGGGFIGDIPRGGLGEEAATLDRLLTLSRFSPSPICGSFIVRARTGAIGMPFVPMIGERRRLPRFYTIIDTFSILIRFPEDRLQHVRIP